MGGKNVCVVPGVYDPVTNGHLDVITRAAGIFDTVYAVSFENSAKKTMFTQKERLEMLFLACGGIGGAAKIITDAAGGLVTDYAKSKNAGFIVRGVRNIMDFEWEYDIFRVNNEIGGIDTLFFPAKTEHLYISSTFVREMIIYKSDISDYVPEKVCEYIKKTMDC